MKKPLVLMSLLLVLFGLHPAPVRADTVLLPDGDRLVGKLLTPHVAVQTPYGQVVVSRQLVRKIVPRATAARQAYIQSVNNDFFSGRILNETFELLLENGGRKSIGKGLIRAILLESPMEKPGAERRIQTTIFTMRNNDRFSGKLLASELIIRTDYTPQPFRRGDFNRIEFTDESGRRVELRLTNGDRIRGALAVRQLEVAPDVVGPMNLDTGRIRSIQFNAVKLVFARLADLPASERDADGDGVADARDRCPGTSWGVPVDADGCPATAAVKTPENQPQAIAAAPPPRPKDSDGDGIADDRDRCPQTPKGAVTDDSGCWRITDVLFDFDRFDLKPDYRPGLDAVAVVLVKNPGLVIELHGHTDDVGSEAYNQRLSENRARAVQRYLMSRGIASRRLPVKGYGSRRPKDSNRTAAGRAHNRRVELVVRHLPAEK